VSTPASRIALLPIVRCERLFGAGGDSRIVGERACRSRFNGRGRRRRRQRPPWRGGTLSAGQAVRIAYDGIIQLVVLRVRDSGVDGCRRRPRCTTRSIRAQNAIDLWAAGALLARGAVLIEVHQAARPTGGADDVLVERFTETRLVKPFVNEAAWRVVDRALALQGGAGYLNGLRLARVERGGRASAFMRPLGANRAHELRRPRRAWARSEPVLTA
jgi:hypothetical protein